ncbi:MAG: hypothetical protein H0U87_08170 [Acidobacteria bacterium]|jgi:hypothetical protein|nr:hypothetical protein [Acidobacteriota bacterium]
MGVVDYLQDVNDRETFIRFVQELAKDKRCAEDWQNETIEDYLESSAAWLADSKRNDFSWKLMAEFLYCGKIYE